METQETTNNSSTIDVSYVVIDTAFQLTMLLKSLPDTVALDFEAKCIYTAEQKQAMKQQLENDLLTFEQKRILRQRIAATALSNPCFVKLTHWSIAYSKDKAYVVVFVNQRLLDIALKWIVTTSRKQIWHNASYDLKLVHYLTGKYPKDVEDTAVYAKTLLNHTFTPHAKTRLKLLMGYAYGTWAVSPDTFETVDLYDPAFLKYAGTDACATFHLFENMQAYTKE